MSPATETIEVLVYQYYKLVFHTIYGLTNNWEESQDLTQDTFQQALKGIEAARASSGEQFNAKAWLLRIALNTVRMQRRRRALFEFVPFSYLWGRRGLDEEDNQDGEAALHAEATPVQPGGYGKAAPDPAEFVAEQDVVRRTMAQLPETLRGCLLLSIVAGLSIPEIAQILDLKEVAVRQRLVRARKQFQEIYQQESGQELIDPDSSIQAETPSAKKTTKRARQKRTHGKTEFLSPLAPQSPEMWSGYA